MSRRNPAHYKNWGNLEIELEKEKRIRFHNKKAQMKRENRLFDTTFEEIVWNEKCPIFGCPLKYFSEGREGDSPSIAWTSYHDKYGEIPRWETVSWRAGKILSASKHKTDVIKVAEYLKSLYNI